MTALRSFRFILAVYLLFGIPELLSATTYYLDFTAGSDANDGLSPATAWQHLQRIRTQGPQPGDVFLFKRGERWAGLQFYLTHSGTDGNPITYGTYGTTSDPAAVITSVTALPGATDPPAWSSAGGDLWMLPLATTPGRLFLDGTEVLRASAAIGEIGTTDNVGTAPQWFHTGGTLYLQAPGNPASTYGRIEGSVLFYTALVDGADYIHFDGLDFQGGLGASLAIFGAAQGVVRNGHLGRYGNSGLLLGDANLGGTATATSAVLVEDNVFDSAFTFYYGTGSERGCGDGLRMIYGVEGCLVQNNTFRNWAHNAVELRAELAGRSGVHTNLIYQNTIEAPDIPYAHPFGGPRVVGPAPDIGPYETDVASALPVTWIYFRATARLDRTVELTRGTALERNSDRFVVQRSLAGRQWQAVGTVAAAGDSEQSREYTFVDRPVPAGEWYYRLRQVDRIQRRPVAPARNDYLGLGAGPFYRIQPGRKTGSHVPGNGRTRRIPTASGALPLAHLPPGRGALVALPQIGSAQLLIRPR